MRFPVLLDCEKDSAMLQENCQAGVCTWSSPCVRLGMGGCGPKIELLQCLWGVKRDPSLCQVGRILLLATRTSAGLPPSHQAQEQPRTLSTWSNSQCPLGVIFTQPIGSTINKKCAFGTFLLLFWPGGKHVHKSFWPLAWIAHAV